MRKNWGFLGFIVLGLTVVVLGILIIANQAQIATNRSYEKNDLVTVIKEYQKQAKFNQVALEELKKIAEKAKYNQKALKTAAYILFKAGFNTRPVLEIARIAGNADREVGLLNDLLELVITYGDGENLVSLAREAVKKEISEADLLERMTFYRNHSWAKTIDEAVAKADSELAGITKKIEAVIEEIQQKNNLHPQKGANNPKNASLITAIKGYMRNGRSNQSLTELLKIAANAAYNQSVIQTAAYFLAQEGSFQNWTVISISKLAGAADREIKQLNDLLEVSITYGGDSLTIIELTIRAVKNDISEAELESRIAFYRNNANSKTIDEALENNKKTMTGF